MASTNNSTITTEKTSTSTLLGSTGRPPTTPKYAFGLSADTVIIIAAAVPSGVAFILAIALITVIACWCCSCRHAKRKTEKRKTSVAVGLESIEAARTRSLREAEATRLQLLQDGANQIGYANPQDVQHDEYYQNTSEAIRNQVKARFVEMEKEGEDYENVETNGTVEHGEDYENIDPNELPPAPIQVRVLKPPVHKKDDYTDVPEPALEDEDYENVDSNELAKALKQAAVLRPIQKRGDDTDDEKEEHDYVNVPKGAKPGQGSVKAPVLARVFHLIETN